jgi:CheY-like chemotaxis protein
MTLPSHDPIVLVVEDDPLLRMVAVENILEAKCTFFEAANADEAMTLLDAHPEISVLFTDITMPGSMDGLHLARAAKASRPDLVVVITSGYLKPGSSLPQGAVFFRKPYTFAELTHAIRRCACAPDHP